MAYVTCTHIWADYYKYVWIQSTHNGARTYIPVSFVMYCRTMRQYVQDAGLDYPETMQNRLVILPAMSPNTEH